MTLTAQRLPAAGVAMEDLDRRQGRRGAGAGSLARLDRTLGAEMRRQRFAQERLRARCDRAAPGRRGGRRVEAGVGHLQPEELCPPHAGARRIGGLRIGEVVGDLHDSHRGASGGCCGPLPVRRDLRRDRGIADDGPGLAPAREGWPMGTAAWARRAVPAGIDDTGDGRRGITAARGSAGAGDALRAARHGGMGARRPRTRPPRRYTGRAAVARHAGDAAARPATE